MDQKMTEQKAFWHALMTVGLAALLVIGFLLYLLPSHLDFGPAVIVTVLVIPLILLPMVYRKYVNGPPPPLTRQQHLKRAVVWGLLGCAYVVSIFVDHRTGWGLVWKWSYSGSFLLTALDHLRRAYKKEANPSPLQ